MYMLRLKVCGSTPYIIVSNIEKVIGWLTFGLYKPWVGATLCGILDEWKEVRKHEVSNEG